MYNIRTPFVLRITCITLVLTSSSYAEQSCDCDGWVQGASGVGYGNFQEVGPLTVDLKPWSSTWLNAAHLFFVVILGQRPARLISYLYSEMPSIAPVGKWKGDLLVLKVFEGNVERGESGRFENAELGALDGLAGGLLSKIDLADAAIKPEGVEVNFIVAGCENTITAAVEA